MVWISTAQQLLRERQSRGISWVGKVAEMELLQMYEGKCLHHKCALVSVLYLCSLMSRVSVVTVFDSRINKAILLSFTKASKQILYPPCALNQIFSLHMLTATIEMKTQTHINNTQCTYIIHHCVIPLLIQTLNTIHKFTRKVSRMQCSECFLLHCATLVM